MKSWNGLPIAPGPIGYPPIMGVAKAGKGGYAKLGGAPGGGGCAAELAPLRFYLCDMPP